MIKRITKATGLLMSAATIVSIMPAYAADLQKVDVQDGYIYNAKVKSTYAFVDGELNGQDEAVYWITPDGKSKKLDVETHSKYSDMIYNQYLEVNTNSSDFTYFDTKNDMKEVDYDVRDSLEGSVANTIKGKLKHDNDGRFDDDKLSVPSDDFQKYYNREKSSALDADGSDKRYNGFLEVGNGLSIFQIQLKDALDSGITNKVTYKSDVNGTSKDGTNTSAVYGDSTGAYVDADYNLGSLKIYAGSTTSASVTLKNTDDSYDLKKDGKTYKLKAVLSESKYVTKISDDIYRWAKLTIYKKASDETSYSKVTKDDGFKFGGKLTVDGTVEVLHKFSYTPNTTTADGIKYPKTSTIYFAADEDGKACTTTDITNLKSNLKQISNTTNFCTWYKDTANSDGSSKIHVANLKLAHKNDFNYLDVDDYEDNDISTTSTADSGGVPYFLNDSYMLRWDGKGSFEKVARVDSALNSLSFNSTKQMLLWNSDKEIYSFVNIAATKDAAKTTATTDAAKTATTTGAAATVTAGWTKNSDNTWSYLENGTKKTGWLNNNGAWYFLKADGIMATAWVNDNGTWYYCDPTSGAMKTGWINDNGTWYYCDASGAMLSNTTVDGYQLGTDGAWVK